MGGTYCTVKLLPFYFAVAISQARFYVQIKDASASVNYLFDETSMKEILENPDWITQADERIEKHRMSNIEIV